ncbi:MAG: phosphoenolpyruvate synthase/pyruvate phosphate dikinase [Desulfobacteraceae bacterium]|nr:MAG: phosphoenolpyruvate synthase/pyruvate phosphate dikinase [Desulfobacteraceae bacterium]
MAFARLPAAENADAAPRVEALGIMPVRRKYDRLEPSFKVFYELMARRVQEILLISTPYDAFIMEEDGRLAGRIIHEYRGLNLTRPPRISWVSGPREALQMLSENPFDLVISVARREDMPPAQLCSEISMHYPQVPICFLSHQTAPFQNGEAETYCREVGRRFVWLGNTDLLLALVKSTEDRWNVDFDTRAAGVRVILLVEDSPLYLSSLLPFIYKEIVRQTQLVMDESLNEEHRILRMRGRPKILLAGSFESALALYRRFAPFMLTVLCDARFSMGAGLNKEAGIDLLAAIQKDNPELPLLLFSSEPGNRSKAEALGVRFIDKNSSALHQELREFFIRSLGFEEFVFRFPDGREVARAATLRSMAQVLDTIPDASIEYHARREDFSTWMMARMEIELAQSLRAVKVTDFASLPELRSFIRDAILTQRQERQRGVVVDVGTSYDPTAEFARIGRGSLGGKARGLAFLAALLKNAPDVGLKYPNVDIRIPRTMVLTTECFDAFLKQNNLPPDSVAAMADPDIEHAFTAAVFPEEMALKLASFLASAVGPLAVRSSSLHEDAQAQPSAGIYKTVMIPNQHPNTQVRLTRLLHAVQRVYASTYFASSRAFAGRSPYRTEEDRMAVLIQPVVGQTVESRHYPAISGLAQSYNFYPVAYMKPEEGIVHIALGLGRAIVEGWPCLRFSPRYPQLLPQIDSLSKVLENAQRSFFALKLPPQPESEPADVDALLEVCSVDDMAHHPAVRLLSSTYVEADQRIRDTGTLPGRKLITFASVLKHDLFPLAEVVTDLLDMGQRGMGCPVEIEFAVDPPPTGSGPYVFWLLQIRPMAKREQSLPVTVSAADERRAFCFSRQALGNGSQQNIQDLLLVPPERFDPDRTKDIAAQIAHLNRIIARQGRRYVLIGPGRWGSADHRLGIPVTWNDISAVAAIVETTAANLNADPSQGSHFFHNIATLGIGYLTVAARGGGWIDWDRLMALAPQNETRFVRHVTLEKGLVVKIDGKSSAGVLMWAE